MSDQLHALRNNILQAAVIALSGVLIFAVGYMVVEPTVSRAIVGTPFTIRTQITPEISFLVQAANVIATGTIAGVTGGNATGTTQAVVQTNSAGGYTMDISFLNNPSMLGETTGSTAIRDYGTTTEPTYLFYASTSASFSYSVNASTTSDLDPSFRNNGTSCNVGASYTANTCWKGPTTSNYRIIDRTTAANSGATTTLTFKVHVPSSPIPALVSDFYTATATLTALTQ